MRSLSYLRRVLADDGKTPHVVSYNVALFGTGPTYDERMFEALRTRAQVFEILTGGDPTADRTSENLWLEADDEGATAGADFVPLPQEILDALRVQLEVEQQDGAR